MREIPVFGEGGRYQTHFGPSDEVREVTLCKGRRRCCAFFVDCSGVFLTPVVFATPVRFSRQEVFLCILSIKVNAGDMVLS